MSALREFIAAEKTGVFGLDFPFGLPRALIAGKRSWEDFVLSFPDDYSSANKFRHHCRQAIGGHELRRKTDCKSKTPFSPYNLRLYRQTYYGIRDVLHPLVRDRLASVLPMQVAAPDRPWMLEICPASTLKEEQIPSQRYKSKSNEGRGIRHHILNMIEAKEGLCIPAPDVRSKILDDPGGDALDSAIAAFAAFRAICSSDPLSSQDDEVYAQEGYVFV